MVTFSHQRWVLRLALGAAIATARVSMAEVKGDDRTLAKLIAEGEHFEQTRDFTASIDRSERAARLAAKKGRAGDQAWALTLRCRSEWFADRSKLAQKVCEQALIHARAAPFPKAEARGRPLG